jgi:MFS family permease
VLRSREAVAKPLWLRSIAARRESGDVWGANSGPNSVLECVGHGLTAVAYFVAVMAALVVLGRLSNHVGRRPVALAALAVTAAGTLLLTEVHSVAPLIAGPVLQGIGCGLASSALAAFIIDSAPESPSWLASAVTTGSPMVGLTLGALGSGALAEYGPAPRTLVWPAGPHRPALSASAWPCSSVPSL